MKKLTWYLLVLATVFCFCGCKTKEDSSSSGKKPKEVVEYTVFYYKSSGAPWECVYECLIDFEKKTLETKYAENSKDFNEEKYQKETKTLTDEQIKDLQNALNFADVKNWKKQYSPDHPVCDGTFWCSYYKTKSGQEGFIRGNNAWPEDFENISTAITTTGSKFIK